MKVLVIYDMIPEETIKAIVEMTEMEYTLFSIANNTVVNASDMTEQECMVNTAISNALCDKPEYEKHCDYPLDKEYFGKWVSGRSENITDLSDVDKMISCGIYL